MWLRLAFTAVLILITGFVSWKYFRGWWQEGKEEELTKIQHKEALEVKDKIVALKDLENEYDKVREINPKEVRKQRKKVQEVLNL